MNSSILPSALGWGVLDILSSPVAILSPSGHILAVNRAWEDRKNVALYPLTAGVAGENYLAGCSLADSREKERLAPLAAALRHFLQQSPPSAQVEYTLTVSGQEYGVCTRLARWEQDEQVYIVVAHEERLNAGIPQPAEKSFAAAPSTLPPPQPITDKEEGERGREPFSATDFALIFERNPIPIVLTGLNDPRILYVNDAYCHLLGYSRQEIIGHYSTDLGLWINPAERSRLITQLQTQEHFFNAEIKFRHKSGQHIDLLVSSQIIILQDEQHILSAMVDITEHKKVQNALDRERNLFKALIHALPEAIWLKDQKGTYLSGNQAFLDMIGLSEAETWGKTDEELFSPEQAQFFKQTDQMALKARQPFYHEAKLLFSAHTDQSLQLFERIKIPIFLDNNEFLGTMGVARNITQQRQIEREKVDAEARVKASQKYLDLILDTAMDAIITVDDNHKIFLFNKAAERLFGCSASEIIGQSVEHLIPERYRMNHWQLMQTFSHSAVTDGNEVYLREIQALRFDGTEFPAEAAVSHVRSENKHLYTIILRNISERKQMEADLADERTYLAQRVAERTAELYQSNIQLAHASRMKDDFLATMSHELRTPLNGIINLSESLEEGVYEALTPKQTEIIHLVNESGHHLLSLINDILDYAKIEAGKVELQLNLLHAETICSAILRLIKQSAQQKNLQTFMTIDSRITHFVADDRRLKQILVNLLGNAVKFTPAGGKIGLELTLDSSGDWIYFTVWDTGIGIAPENKGKLFKPFMQIDSALNREFAGTGLGLALVKELVTLHGGTIDVESTPGQGSRFFFTLPFIVSEENIEVEDDFYAAYTPLMSSDPVTKKHKPLLLLAEDNALNKNVIKDYLRFLGYQVVTASNGYEAVQMAQEFGPRLILMDIQMAEMDGLEATRRLRAMPEFASVPIVALTALAMRDDKEKALAAGVSQYVTKPVKLNKLAHLIDFLLSAG